MQIEENEVTTNCQLDQTQEDKSLSQAHYHVDEESPKQKQKTPAINDIEQIFGETQRSLEVPRFSNENLKDSAFMDKDQPADLSITQGIDDQKAS